MNPYKRAEQIDRSLDRIERGLYSELSMDSCCNFIDWLAKFHKVPETVWAPLADKATRILDQQTAALQRQMR